MAPSRGPTTGPDAPTPRRFYFDNVTGMIDLERTFGFTSTFYLINGSGGRFGARSGSDILGDVAEVIPEGYALPHDQMFH